jgi:hypothetical protein
MACTQLATIVEASGILQAVALTRIGGGSEASLVGVTRIDEDDDHEPQERGHDEQDLSYDARHSSRILAPCAALVNAGMKAPAQRRASQGICSAV